MVLQSLRRSGAAPQVLRWWGFSDEFATEMVFPLTALFFGTGNQVGCVGWGGAESWWLGAAGPGQYVQHASEAALLAARASRPFSSAASRVVTVACQSGSRRPTL